MKIHYAWIAVMCVSHIHTADKLQRKIDPDEVSIELLKDHSEWAGDCSKIWYEVLGKNKYPDYEAIKKEHTQFIQEHANDTELPLMLVAILKSNGKLIGMCALRKTCYPRKGVVPWADEHPEITPWLAGFAVDEAYQGTEVGIKIVKEILKYARDKLGFDEAYLLPESSEIAETYTRRGAVKVADVTRDGKEASVMKIDTNKLRI